MGHLIETKVSKRCKTHLYRSFDGDSTVSNKNWKVDIGKSFVWCFWAKKRKKRYFWKVTRDLHKPLSRHFLELTFYFRTYIVQFFTANPTVPVPFRLDYPLERYSWNIDHRKNVQYLSDKVAPWNGGELKIFTFFRL